MSGDEMNHYGVRSIIQHGDSIYEERIVLIAAEDEDQALELGEAEARTYSEYFDNVRPLDFVQLYVMEEGPIGPGSEIYSLMRTSDLGPDDYLNRFFDTGDELQRD